MAQPRITADNARIVSNVLNDPRMLTYADRITPATQGAMKETLQSLQSFEPAWNTFIEVLLDNWALALFRARSWENKLARFKTGRIQEGSWAYEVGAGLVQAHSYDKHATDVFSLEEPEITVNFHFQNRKDRYKISYSEDIIAQAMLTEGGLSQVIGQIIAMPQNSDNIDEYLIMRELFAHYNEEQGFFNYQVPDLAISSDPKADGQKITQMIRETYLDFGFPNKAVKYNNEHLPYVSNEVVLFATPKFLSINDVYNLASAFNLDYANFTSDVLQVVDELPIPGAQAILADSDWFVCTDTKIKTASIYDPANDVTNTFLHHWGIYSASRMAPAVLFSTAADSKWELVTPTVTGVALALPEGTEYAQKGANTQLVTTVSGTGDFSHGVTYELSSAAPLSTNTHISANGTLWVGTDERNTMITVRAVSVADTTKYATLAVGVSAKYTASPAVTSVNVSGGSSVNRGATEDYTAAVTPEGSGVTWAVLGLSAQSGIDQAGKLTVGENEPNGSATVIAVSVVDPTKVGSIAVTITNPDE